MNYSKVKKEFSSFNVELKTVGELKKEIKKMIELKVYYDEKYLNTSFNMKYFYDLWEFYAERELELELSLGHLLKKVEKMRNERKDN